MINNNIFTFPLNPPLAKGDLWQGCALLAYGDGGYRQHTMIITLKICSTPLSCTYKVVVAHKLLFKVANRRKTLLIAYLLLQADRKTTTVEVARKLHDVCLKK